jgi:hypothetical protein
MKIMLLPFRFIMNKIYKEQKAAHEKTLPFALADLVTC